MDDGTACRKHGLTARPSVGDASNPRYVTTTEECPYKLHESFVPLPDATDVSGRPRKDILRVSCRLGTSAHNQGFRKHLSDLKEEVLGHSI